MSNNPSQRRRLKGFLLEPRAQLRYGLHFFLLSAGVVLLAQVVTLWSLRAVVGRILQQAGGETARLQAIIGDAVSTSFLSTLWVLPGLGIAVMALAIYLSHRYVGPQVAIKRQIRQLEEGNYGVQCRLRTNDELKEVAGGLNRLSTRLQERHGSVAEEMRLREAGFSLIELVMVLALIAILVGVAVSQLVAAYDRSRQRSTMADMHAIASANGSYNLANNVYAASLADLWPDYMDPVPPLDRWGFAWSYSGAADDYTLSSLGADGAAGPPPPDPWYAEPFAPDLIVENGSFSQAPSAR